MILGAIPSSGLTANAPLFAQIVGMLIAALAAFNYTVQRTALKRAHLAVQMAGASAPITSSKVPQLAASGALVVLIVALGVIHGYGCAGVGTGTPIAAAGNAFLQCGKQDLTQLVGPKGWTLLATVNDDLAKDDYDKLIADLVGTVGGDAVGCAVVAIDSLGKTTIAPRVLTPREVRAQELIVKYSWKTAPAPTTPASTAPASSK